MILVFGGTTEGRKAAEVLEEAGTTYYYSTRGDSQRLHLVHGIRLTGGMEAAEMEECCRQNDIRLLIDAAHPFAEALHSNLLAIADRLRLPVVRYERIYPPHDGDIIWCQDYNDAIRQMETQGIRRLLALTGTNTIRRLRPFWEKHECWIRILHREESVAMACEADFPHDHLSFYEEEETGALIRRLRPDAILTKESGTSGGFNEKVKEARKAGVRVFAVERPPYPPRDILPVNTHVVSVDGPHGLRRAVERLLPSFFPLHSGLTTGTCATAAAVAACLRLTRGETPGEVPVILPDGETIHVGVGYADGYAYVVKEAGDDPDVTDGIEIRASVVHARKSGGLHGAETDIRGGEGVGTFTLPGFDYPPGSPAINKGPRQMIRDNLAHIAPQAALCVTISIPQGKEIAQRTFNPRLGIEGGISVIGVSGIVKPFSEEAFILSIRKCMEVAKASGTQQVVVNSGAKSERYIKARFPQLPRQAFVEYGNYIGETLKMAGEMQFPHVTLGIMLGKAVKLAAGHLDTHSRKATFDRDFILLMLEEAHCTADISDITLARELWHKIPSEKTRDFANVVVRHCLTVCQPLLPASRLDILLIDDEGNIYG